jgi:hypothetical protein
VHLEGAAERSKAAYEYIEPAGFEIHGDPGTAILDQFRGIARADVRLDLAPDYAGGFLRLAGADADADADRSSP